MTFNFQRPVPLRVRPETIWEELKSRPQWVCWRYVWRDGRWTKVPCKPDGGPASSTDPLTFSTFEACLRAYQSGGFDGIGFVSTPEDPFVLIDLDHVMPPDSPMPDWAKSIVTTAIREGAYVETSVGGDGIHIIGKGPQGFKGRKANQIEIYSSGRFFTITGETP